ncbi:MAG: hypothetical protein HKN04_04345, partial [Rhodothermaceae bacterium]|nr:hypothetical protein [Rhodothermaceae bacterium]
RWPSPGTVRTGYLDLNFLAADGRDGRLVGLWGDGDGDETDDFRTRDGRTLPTPPDFDTLYDVFAQSWRVRPEESLFTYGLGESTTTFTDLDFPERPATLDDLSPEDQRRAEAACREAGITDPDALRDCILDVGLTGDERFIASARAQQAPPELLSAPPLSIAGVWDTSYNLMRLNQDGEQITGTYEDGSRYVGGTFRDTVLDGFWWGEIAGVRCDTAHEGTHYWGRIRFTFMGANRFEGAWGYCDQDLNGGWEGSRR